MKYAPTVVAKVRAPKGFHFQIQKDWSHCDCVYVGLIDNSKNDYVGKITLVKTSSNPVQYETHSWLHQKYHGRGLGTKIYARAIQWCLENGYRVRSSGISSTMAIRVRVKVFGRNLPFDDETTDHITIKLGMPIQNLLIMRK